MPLKNLNQGLNKWREMFSERDLVSQLAKSSGTDMLTLFPSESQQSSEFGFVSFL